MLTYSILLMPQIIKTILKKVPLNNAQSSIDVSDSLMRRCSVATPLFSAADRTQTKAARRRPDQRLHPQACLYLQLTRELCGFDRPISPDSPNPPPPLILPRTARSLSFLPAPTGNHITVAADAITALVSSEPGLMLNRLIICLISH